MGGYGLYVWGSYAAAAAVLFANAIAPLVRARTVRKELAEFLRLEKSDK